MITNENQRDTMIPDEEALNYDEQRRETELWKEDPMEQCWECGDRRGGACQSCGAPLCYRHMETMAGFCGNFTSVNGIPGCDYTDQEVQEAYKEFDVAMHLLVQETWDGEPVVIRCSNDEEHKRMVLDEEDFAEGVELESVRCDECGDLLETDGHNEDVKE